MWICVCVVAVMCMQLAAQAFDVDLGKQPTVVGGLRRVIHMLDSGSPHWVWVCDTHWQLRKLFGLTMDGDGEDSPDSVVREAMLRGEVVSVEVCSMTLA